jgi:3-phytase
VRRLTLAFVLASGALTAQADELLLTPILSTVPLYSYDGAPATPDADDPAIWINYRNRTQSLVIGTAKDAGLLVYDLAGNLVQAILPPNAPQVLPVDPPTPSGVNLAPDNPCIDSEEGETFGRFNNVDIAYNIRLGDHPHAPRADVAVVSDRGCDRIRFFKIDPSGPDGPLVINPRISNRPAHSRAGATTPLMTRTRSTG